MLEMVAVMGLTMVLAAIALPVTSNTVGDYRLRGDARAIASSVSLVKLAAASKFTNARLFVDLGSKSFHTEVYDKGTPPAWTMQPGSVTLSGSDTFGFGDVSSAPPNTQDAIGQAPACLTVDNEPIDGTACIVFNSRGVPVDSSGAPYPQNALYITEGTTVYGMTLSATGMLQSWQTIAGGTSAWVPQ